MLKTRVMPCLLLRNQALVKTVKFRQPSYVGDVVNTIRIYNEKEVDELILLDIAATPERRRPNFDLLRDVSSECFMPFAYGGGVRSIEDAGALFGLGAEKVVVNSHALERPEFIGELAAKFGSQSVIVSIDARKRLFGGYRVFSHGGRTASSLDPVAWAVQAEKLGAGEILLTAMDRDGTFEGYDLELIKSVSARVSVPVVACGGAGRIEDFGRAVREGGASAVATGSMVVYQGRNRAVLINFPPKAELAAILVSAGMEH